MPKIQMSFINGGAFIFNAEDYMSIRREHRIVGKLIGCSSKWPRNTNIPGLPAIYSPYETQLLINKGIVQLCKKDLHGPPSDQIKQQYSDFLKGQAETFNDIYREKRVEETKKIMPKILEGKRKKVLQTGGNPDDVKEEDILNDVRKRCKFDEKTMFVQLPMQEPFPAEFVELETVPNLDQLKYRVFEHLYDEGHWLTASDTFGGDFMIYPNDPIYFHASHIIHVLKENEASSMDTKTLITRCRLSVTVNKFCVFAYEHPESKELRFQTYKWKGK